MLVLNGMRFHDAPARLAATLLVNIDLNRDGRIVIAREHERTFEMNFVFVPTTQHDEFLARLKGIDLLGNRDGEVTMPEAERFFTRADADHDGWLSSADLGGLQGMFPVVTTRTPHDWIR